MRKMISTSPKVYEISELLCLDINFKKVQDVLNTQRGSSVELGAKRNIPHNLCMVLLVYAA